MHVVICGGGVIGTSTAYFLARRGIDVTVVESTDIACAASGHSGGFLARDWCDGTPLAPLARRSFDLHAELAATLDDDWGYRRLDTLSVAASARRVAAGRPAADMPEWIADDARLRHKLGTAETTAQIDPAAFTKGMMEAAAAIGARLVDGRVDGIARNGDNQICGVTTGDDAIAADAVVIAMGPV